MSRTLTLFIFLAIVVGGFLLLRYAHQSYNSLPTEEETSTTPNVKLPAYFNDWREYSSPSDHFKARFPGLPQHATEKISDPKTGELRKYDTFVAADNEGPAFMVSSITFPKSVSEADLEGELKSVVNDMLQRNKENKLRSMQMDNFRDMRALNFSITNGELLIKGKVFASGNRLYVISMIGSQSNFNPKALDFFENSFQVNKNQTPNPEEKK